MENFKFKNEREILERGFSVSKLSEKALPEKWFSDDDEKAFSCLQK
jgi:hypothetical protein